MPNAWIIHLKAFRAKNKGMSLSTAMKEAKKTYKKKAPGATKVKKVKATAKAPKSKAIVKKGASPIASHRNSEWIFFHGFFF